LFFFYNTGKYPQLILPNASALTRMPLSLDLFFVNFYLPATKWRDSAGGQHVGYDQRPDAFRYVFYCQRIVTLILCLNIYLAFKM
jgi:hypothetical protein